MMENANPNSIISIRNIWKYFGKNVALQDVSLDIAAGERVVVIGPSGSGKSTLLRSINRLEEIDRGHIFVQGKDITDHHNDINVMRRNLGMVFQQFNLFPHKTVLQNVTLAPIKLLKLPRKKAEDRAFALLKRVGISDKANVYPAQLSGGQQQRVAIARALASEARVLLADEPTGNLDEDTAGEIIQLIKRTAHELGKCVIVVTHSRQLAGEADEVLELSHGKLYRKDAGEEKQGEDS